jgi:hypothetical protein
VATDTAATAGVAADPGERAACAKSRKQPSDGQTYRPRSVTH